EAHPGAAGHTAHETLTWLQAEQCGPERLNAAPHGLLRPRAERDRRDPRADANDDAQHSEQRAELVRPQRLERHHDDLAQEHRYRAPAPESTSTVSFSARPPVTSM